MSKNLDWRVSHDAEDFEGGDIHCTPNNDLEPHIEEVYCACKPTKIDETEDGQVWMHHAYDEREVIESIFEKQS